MESICSHTVKRTGDTCYVVLAGELDMSVVDQVSRLLVGEVRRPGTASVIVDLGPLDFLDASGINALIIGYNAARIQGRNFAVTRAHGLVRRVLELTGLLAFLSHPVDVPRAERRPRPSPGRWIGARVPGRRRSPHGPTA